MWAAGPRGEWLRRYWLVVGTTKEPRDIPVSVLGEDLVLFRDLKGRIGLIGLYCPHRGSSLEYGDLDRGIRCPYHAWLFDVSGNCLEQPAEPKDSQDHKKVRHVSYPVRVWRTPSPTWGPDRDNPPPQVFLS